MKQIVSDMLKIYKPFSNMDWLNYKIVRKQDMTAHHIIKREHGGKLEMSNIALLLPHAHQYLHLIECKDIKTYMALNKLFTYINQQRYEPTQEQREIIEYLLTSFEDVHRYDKGSKGKLIIKRKYLDRGML